MTTVAKAHRLEARIEPEIKEIISRAAELSGFTLSHFVIQTAYQKALETLAQQRVWQLHQEDQQLFVQTLMQPPQATEALKSAVRRSQERFGK